MMLGEGLGFRGSVGLVDMAFRGISSVSSTHYRSPETQ